MNQVKIIVLIACLALAIGLPLEEDQAKAQLSADFHHFPGDGHNHNSDLTMRAKHHPLDGHDHHGVNYEDYQGEPSQDETQESLVDANKGKQPSDD